MRKKIKRGAKIKKWRKPAIDMRKKIKSGAKIKSGENQRLI